MASGAVSMESLWRLQLSVLLESTNIFESVVVHYNIIVQRVSCKPHPRYLSVPLRETAHLRRLVSGWSNERDLSNPLKLGADYGLV